MILGQPGATRRLEGRRCAALRDRGDLHNEVSADIGELRQAERLQDCLCFDLWDAGRVGVHSADVEERASPGLSGS